MKDVEKKKYNKNWKKRKCNDRKVGYIYFKCWVWWILKLVMNCIFFMFVVGWFIIVKGGMLFGFKKDILV